MHPNLATKHSTEGPLIYDGVSKIFRTDAVKIIKFTIRPICRYHPRSSSIPFVDTDPTVSRIFVKIPANPFLSQCQALSAIRPGLSQCLFSFIFIFGNRSNRLPNQESRWVGDDSHFLFRQELLGEDGSVRGGVVMKQQPGQFSPEFGVKSSHVFTKSPQNIAVEPGIHSLACWDRCFALPQLLYRWGHQSAIFWIPPRISAILNFTRHTIINNKMRRLVLVRFEFVTCLLPHSVVKSGKESVPKWQMVDGRLGSRLRCYHPVAPRFLRYGPFVHRL
jgi:hypothetical protein